MGQPQLGAGPPEELGVLRDGARPATLDEPDTELVDEFCAEGEKDYERLQRSRGK